MRQYLVPGQDNALQGQKGKTCLEGRTCFVRGGCWKLPLFPTRYSPSAQRMDKRRKPCSKHDLLVCMCVRTVRGALWEQCSVQFRSEQRRPGPGQSQSSGNPCVFRSPGPYLMSLSKKKVALSRAFLSHCLPLALLFPSFSHTPRTQHPLKPLCEWMNSKCLLSSSALSPVCCAGLYRKEGGRMHSHHTLTTWSHQIEASRMFDSVFSFFCIATYISNFRCTSTMFSVSIILVDIWSCCLKHRKHDKRTG